VPEPGWLARQLENVREESAKLPFWMQYPPKQEQPPTTSKSKSSAKTTVAQAKKRG
jgi:hypothetical protein